MRVILILLLTLPCWAADWGTPYPCNPDTLTGHPDSVYIWASSPDSGEIGVSNPVTIRWAVPSYPNLTRSMCKIWIAGKTALSGDSVKTGFAVAVASDTVNVSRTTAFDDYFEIEAVLWVTPPGQRTPFRTDTVVFRTAGGVEPFHPYTIWGRSFSDSTATGQCTVKIMRPYGSTVYVLDPDTEETLIYTPSSVYATERRARVIQYLLTGVPRGRSVYRFFAVAPAMVSTDTLRLIFQYVQVEGGLPRGAMGQ